MKLIFLLTLVLSVFIVGCEKQKTNNIKNIQVYQEEIQEEVQEEVNTITDEVVKKELYLLKDYENKLVNSAYLDLYIFMLGFDANKELDYIHKSYLKEFKNELNKELSIDIYNNIEKRYIEYIENLTLQKDKMLEESISNILLDFNKLVVFVSNFDNEKRKLTNDIRDEFKLLRKDLKERNENYNQINDEVNKEYKANKTDKEKEFKTNAINIYDDIVSKLYTNKTSLTILNLMYFEELEKFAFVY